MAKNDYQLGQATTNRPMRGPMRVAEKPKDFKRALKMLIQYLRKFLPALCVAFSCAFISVIFTLFGPDFLSKITDRIDEGMTLGHVDTDAVLRLGIMVMLFYVFSALLSFLQELMLVNTTQSIMRHMRNDISHKLNRIPLKRFDSASFGDLLSRVTNDVDTIGMSLHHAAVEVVTAIATFVGVTIMMLVTNVWLALIALFSSLVGFFFMNFLIRKSQPFFSARQR